jgi:hypothetical protein
MSSSDIYDGPNAMLAFKEYLQLVSPETWELLKAPNVSFPYLDRFEFGVIGTKEFFDQLSNPPHIDRLKEATGTIEFDVRITFREFQTGLEYETVIARTKNGIEVLKRSYPAPRRS